MMKKVFRPTNYHYRCKNCYSSPVKVADTTKPFLWLKVNFPLRDSITFGYYLKANFLFPHFKNKKMNLFKRNTFVLILFIFMYLHFVPAQTTFRKLTEGDIVHTLSDSRSVNFADFNKDGLEDIFITQGLSTGAPDLLYYNKGNLVFERQAEITNSVSDPSVGATIGDMNNDGFSDIFVASWYNKKNVLFRSKGSNEYEIIRMNALSYSESATWGDYDNDGFLDLYVSNSGNNLADNYNFLYKNEAGTLQLQQHHITVKETNFSRGSTWIDYDNDGDIDLFICNENQTRKELFRNDANGNFTKITSAGDLLEEASGSMSASWADVNNDGWMDVFICNSGFFTGQTNRLYINKRDGTFTRKEGVFESDLGCSFSASFADYDNDGDTDLFVTNGFCHGIIQNFLYQNDGAGNFTKDLNSIPDLSTKCSFGVAWGDLNNDGNIDLVIANCKNSSQASLATNSIWINDGNQHSWLKIKLEGVVSNNSAIGAKVIISSVVTGERRIQKRELTSLSGYCSQNSSILHFGLGETDIVDTITIFWPSGIKHTFTNINPNQLLHINENTTSTLSFDNAVLRCKVSPVPTSSNIDIDATFNKIPDTLYLEIYNAEGKKVYQNTYKPTDLIWHQSIDLNHLKIGPGLYLVSVMTGTWSITKKIVFNP